MSESSGTDAFNLHGLLQEILRINNQSGMLSTVKIDDEKGTLAVVKPAVAHLVTEAKNYTMSKVKWESTTEVRSAFKKLHNFLSSSEKQIGKNNLQELLEPIMEKVFADTPFHGSAVCMAADNVAWKGILKEFRDIMNIPAIDYSLEVYAKIDEYNPSSDTLLRLAITQVLSWIRQGNRQIEDLVKEADEEWEGPGDISMRSSAATPEDDQPVNRRQLQALLFPSPVIIAAKVLKWVPISMKPVVPVSLMDNNIRYTIDQLVADLEETRRKIPPITKVAAPRKKESSPPQKNQVTAVSGGNDLSPPGLSVPGERPAPPAKRLGRLVARDLRLGACVVDVDDAGEENVVEELRVRVDTGADEDIFDASMIPFAERLGPSDKNYITPLSTRAKRAERGRITFETVDIHGNKVKLVRDGVLDFFGLPALRPDAANFSNGAGSVTVDGFTLPTHPDDKNNAYVKLVPVASETSTKIKTLGEFARNEGFTLGDPPPPISTVAKVLHLKYGCAGKHTLNLTTKLHGFSLPTEAIASAIASCGRCIEKEKNSKVADLLPRPPGLGALRATKDHEVLVLDVAEMPHWTELSHRYILVGKLVSRQFLLIDALGSRSCSSNIIEWLRRHPSIRTLVHDNARDFAPADKYARANGIHVETSPLHRDALKRWQERSVGQAKELLLWCLRICKIEMKGLWKNWQHLVTTAAWIHNTRVSPKLRSVPWSITYATPHRGDLFPFQIVNVITGTRITTSKATARIFLGLKSPTEAVVWNPRTRGVSETVHPTQIRAIRPSVEFI